MKAKKFSILQPHLSLHDLRMNVNHFSFGDLLEIEMYYFDGFVIVNNFHNLNYLFIMFGHLIVSGLGQNKKLGKIDTNLLNICRNMIIK